MPKHYATVTKIDGSYAEIFTGTKEAARRALEQLGVKNTPKSWSMDRLASLLYHKNLADKWAKNWQGKEIVLDGNPYSVRSITFCWFPKKIGADVSILLADKEGHTDDRRQAYIHGEERERSSLPLAGWSVLIKEGGFNWHQEQMLRALEKHDQ